MNRRLIPFVVLSVWMLVPAIAWAGEGSDSDRFYDLWKTYGAAVAVLASFGFGFVASLTPCVYPMVPITVSIFGATQAKSRLRGAALSATFVLGIASLFTPMGLACALTGQLMGGALSNMWVVLALALLFMALAASMFGAFELALPSSLTNKLSTAGGVGFKGAYVMGLVMGLIAAPCTGPFLTGILTVIAKSGEVALGGMALFSFSLGLGVLFFVAGAFAMTLPKGGAWMMGVKWVSGVGLAYMAFAYLRDRFEPVHELITHRSTAYGASAGLLALVGVAFGLVHIAAERRRSPVAHLSKPMKLASIAPAVAGVVMLTSWLGAPPVDTIPWISSEPQGRAKAIAENKPVLLDFGATWCTVCKKLEAKTFPDARVRAEADRFVAIRVTATEQDDKQAENDKYRVVGLPTVIVLDSGGTEVARFNELVGPDALVAAMKKAP